jgi:septal ring factor EnvC (AmiA/AmiB activator)|tara:strand:+ start:881 stop:1279 length:399 start_codon:yes stop_codon:yes gene_type:complete
MNVGTELAENDKILDEIKSIIYATSINMLNSYENVKKSKSKNQYLDIICVEYAEHFDKIIFDKEKQIEHLKNILNYLNTQKSNEVSKKTTTKSSEEKEIKNSKTEVEKSKNEVKKLITSLNKELKNLKQICA